METIVKIDKKAKYIITNEVYGTYEIITGTDLKNRLIEGNDVEGDGLTTDDQIFKLGEEYRVETTLVKVNNNQTKQ